MELYTSIDRLMLELLPIINQSVGKYGVTSQDCYFVVEIKERKHLIS